MGYPPNLSKIVSIAVVFYDSNGDINFLRIKEYYICKIPRVKCLLVTLLLLCMVYFLLQDTRVPPRFLTVRNL